MTPFGKPDIHCLVAGREAVVLQRLGISPQRTGHQRCPFPDHEDKNPSWRWDSGKARWFCTCGNGHGTAVDAVMRMEGLEAGEAIRWIRALLDGDPPPAANANRPRKLHKPADAAQPREDPAAYARKIWARAIPVAGTIAERYLREHRGIAGPLPEPLRMVWSLKHKEADRYFPALLIPAFDQAGALRRLQAVFLDLATGGKAPVPNPKKDGKKTYGEGAGSFPAIFPGRQPGRRFDVILTEGPEDGVVLYSVLQDEGGDIAASLGDKSLHKPEFPPGTRLLIVADGDASGAKAAKKAALAHVGRGCEVWIATPPAGIKDSNALLQASGAAGILAMLDDAQPFVAKAEAAARGITAREAAERTQKATLRFFRKALFWQTETPDPLDFNPRLPPAIAIRATLGAGKTEAVLRALVNPVLADRNVNMYVPAHKLSEELLDRFNAIAGPQSPQARVVYGREQTRPDGTPMCRKADLVKALAPTGQNIQAMLCARKRDDGEIERCEHFDTCPYQHQLADKSPGVRFLSHAHAFVDHPKPSIAIFDESFWRASLRGVDGRGMFIPLWRLREIRDVPRRDKPGRDNDATADLAAITARCVRAIEAGGALADYVANGVTADDARNAMALEYRCVQRLDITPGMPEIVQKARIDGYRSQESLKIARYFRLLARCLEAGIEPVCFELRRNVKNGDGAPEDRLHLYWSADLKIGDVPTLMVDASLEPTIARRFFPHLEEPTVVEAQLSNYHATQITDRRVSKSMLWGPPPEDGDADWRRREHQRRANRRADLRRLVEVEAPRGSVLCVTYKDAADAIEAEGPIPGAHFAHWNALRGRDQWRDCDTLIIAGCPQPNEGAVERMARALFYMDGEPIAPAAGYDTALRSIDMADGNAVDVLVDVHSDPRCTLLLDQVRDEVMQAVGRARLVHREASKPCRIILLTNHPLPLAVHQVTTWQEAMPSPQAVLLARGIVPENKNHAAVMLKDIFPEGGHSLRQWLCDNRAAAEQWDECVRFPYRDSSIGKSDTFARFRYRLAGERKSALAWVKVSRHPDPRAVLEAVFGELEIFEPLQAVEPTRGHTAAAEAAEPVHPEPEPEGDMPDVTKKEPPPKPAALDFIGFGHEDPDYDPWCGWPGPDPDEMRRQPRLVVNNPPPAPPEPSDAELIRLLPMKWPTDTAVGWEIKAHDVLRAWRVDWFRVQRLVREQSAAHDWSRHVRADLNPAAAHGEARAP